MRDRPNIVMVFSDQHRAATMGYQGAPNVKTPNFDRLAEESHNFTNSVSVVPVCTPARASLLTGQYPASQGMVINDIPIRNRGKSVAEAFAGAGYKTAYIGKWHLNGGAWDDPIEEQDRMGFQFWRGWQCCHDYTNSRYWADGWAHPWGGYDAIAQTNAAMDYVTDQARDGPFCLFLSWGPPHDPYDTAPEEFRSMYDPQDMELRGNVPEHCAEQAREALAGYCAHVSALDSCMGRIMDGLEELGLADNTILVYTSDHGDMLYSHGQWTKQKPWDESIKVPFLLRYPDRLGRQGRRVEMPFNSMDVMPTLLDLAGVPVPDTVHGSSVFDRVDGAPDEIEDAALYACFVPIGTWAKSRGGREYRGIRTCRYTYVRNLQGPWLLYDNHADPLQQHNLCDDPNWAQVQQALDDVLHRKLEQREDEFQSAEDYAEEWGLDLSDWGY